MRLAVLLAVAALAPYHGFLEEDAAYIAVPDERRLFTTLHSDEELRQSVEQFWSRRDPTGRVLPPPVSRQRVLWDDPAGYVDTTFSGEYLIARGPPGRSLAEQMGPEAPVRLTLLQPLAGYRQSPRRTLTRSGWLTVM